MFISETDKLRRRIKGNHIEGVANLSTLRVSLAALLYEKSGYSLYKHKQKYLLDEEGEEWLDWWMDENAFVCWQQHADPGTLKKEILKNISVPLNIQNNFDTHFRRKLGRLRGQAIQIS